MLKHWLWLSTLRGLGRKGMLRVLETFQTPEAAFLADRAECSLVPELTAAQVDALQNKDTPSPAGSSSGCSASGSPS